MNIEGNVPKAKSVGELVDEKVCPQLRWIVLPSELTLVVRTSLLIDEKRRVAFECAPRKEPPDMPWRELEVHSEMRQAILDVQADLEGVAQKSATDKPVGVNLETEQEQEQEAEQEQEQEKEAPRSKHAGAHQASTRGVCLAGVSLVLADKSRSRSRRSRSRSMLRWLTPEKTRRPRRGSLTT